MLRFLRPMMAISWQSLRRDRAALALTFVLPLVFFTVFASVFTELDQSDPGPITLSVAVETEGVFSDEVIAVLAESKRLKLLPQSTFDAETTRYELAVGEIDALLLLPANFDEAVDQGETADARIMTDSANPLIAPAVAGHLMDAIIQAATRLSEEDGPDVPVEIEIVDAIGGENKDASTAFFAAGLGVLFLMLSLSNRASLLLEERDNGTLDRMLSTQLSMTDYLLGRGLFLALLGLIQITVMFVWAAVGFGLPLLDHLAGFSLMALLCAVTAASFGLSLAFLCRTREQLTATSVILVLILAAIGGNLFPRFLMPDWLQQFGWYTFNGWALDGFQRVFWYGLPVSSLTQHVVVLSGTTVMFFFIAMWLGKRWINSAY